MAEALGAEGKDSGSDGLKALLDELDLDEAIYLDNAKARPPAVGFPDHYRSARYATNREAGTFERVIINPPSRRDWE